MNMLSAVSYADLNHDLDSQQLVSWEKSYSDDNKQIADYIWYAYAHGYGHAIDVPKARLWFKRSSGPLAKLFGAMSFRNRHWINAHREVDPKTDHKHHNDQLLQAKEAFTVALADDPSAELWLGLTEIELGRMDNGLELLTHALEAGQVEAAAWMGYCYMYRKKNHKLAHKYLNQSHQAGLPWATTLYGDAALRGYGMKRNTKQAIQLFEAAAKQGEPNAILRYAQRGRGSFAFTCAQTSHAQGNPEGSHQLAHRYEHGRDTAVNLDQALEIHHEIFKRFEHSSRWQHYAWRAASEMGRILDSKASKNNHHQSTHKNAAKWHHWIIKHCVNPNDYRVLRAHIALGKQLRYGWTGEKNHAQAVSHFRVAAKFNNQIAQFELAQCYQHGHGVPKDLKKAIELYQSSHRRMNRRAPEKGQIEIEIARCYEAIDPKLAYKQYQKASNRGNAEASYRLVQLMRERKEPQETIKAALSKAAAQGHPQAQQAIESEIREADAKILDEF